MPDSQQFYILQELLGVLLSSFLVPFAGEFIQLVRDFHQSFAGNFQRFCMVSSLGKNCAKI
jgi:hypothetical protein